jgi:hypothetical protein
MKTHDYIHHYRGYWDDGGVCRIRIYEAEDREPVVICSELPENRDITKSCGSRFCEERGAPSL